MTHLKKDGEFLVLLGFGRTPWAPLTPDPPGPDPDPPPDPPTGSLWGVPDSPVEPSGSFVLVQPGSNIQSLVNNNPAGTTFAFAPGVHRITNNINPKAGNTFWGFTGAIISGARLLTGATSEGNGVWSYSGQHDYISWNGAGDCVGGGTLCLRPNDVYIDDVPKYRVGSIGALTEDTYYYDEPAGKVYIGVNPSGKKVELGIAGGAFQTGFINNVTFRNLIFEKFANAAQRGVVMAKTFDGSPQGQEPMGTGWHIRDCTFRWNHGLGVFVGPSGSLVHCDIYENGQLGVSAGGANGRIERCRIFRNKYAQYAAGWEGGGTKFLFSDNLVVRGNHVFDNRSGYGLWTDVNNDGTLYEYNLVEDEDNNGIFHEISYSAIIRRNIVRRAGRTWGIGSTHNWVYGAGILVHNSSDVEVYENVVSDSGGGIVADEGSRSNWILSNVHVRDNIVHLKYFPDRRYWNNTLGVAAPNGVYTGAGAPVYSAARNNRFTGNTYYSPEPFNRNYFRWENDGNWAAWQASGQDTTGSMNAGEIPEGTVPPGWNAYYSTEIVE